eukprot:11766197-Alexandrium_andersonii.AAC.1
MVQMTNGDPAHGGISRGGPLMVGAPPGRQAARAATPGAVLDSPSPHSCRLGAATRSTSSPTSSSCGASSTPLTSMTCRTPAHPAALRRRGAHLPPAGPLALRPPRRPPAPPRVPALQALLAGPSGGRRCLH